MFTQGDYVVYENMGVCQVKDIVPRQQAAADGQMLCYLLQPLSQTCSVQTPVGSTKVYMRPVITKQEAEQLIDSIPDVCPKPYYNKTVSQLTEHYKRCLQTRDCRDMIEMTLSIYLKRKEVEAQNRKFSAIDEKYMKRAEDLLHGELAVALGISVADVPDYISVRVEELGKQALKT